MEQTLDELFGSIPESFADGKMPPGRNPDVECIRLTLDPVKPEHRPLAFYFVVFHISLSDIGRLSPSTFRISPLPCSRIRLLPRRAPLPTPSRILVPCTNNHGLRFTTTRGDPWHWFDPLINLVRHKPRDPSQRPPHHCPRHRPHKHASPTSNPIPFPDKDHDPAL